MTTTAQLLSEGDHFKCQAGEDVDWICSVKAEAAFQCTKIDYSQYYRNSSMNLTTEDVRRLMSTLPFPYVGDILLYRASRDGWRAADFHRYSDNVEMTQVLFKSKKKDRLS